MKKEIILLSIGGSLVVPDGIDKDFLSQFKKLILQYTRKGKRFVITVGGGTTCRIYQDASRDLGNPTLTELDWLGIKVTEVNAYLLKMLFEPHVHPKVITNPTENIRFTKSVLIGAGWKPGCSTDMDAVLLSRKLGIHRLVNLTNIDFVYDKDPRKWSDAKPIHSISWKEFRKIIPAKWQPGLHSPFDPVASRLAQKIKLEVTIMNGKDIANLDNYLSGRDFKGTQIHS